MDWWALGLAIVLCTAMAAAEGLLTGGDLPKWLNSLKHPPLYAPMWVWALVALLTYAIQGFVAYRLIAAPIDVSSMVGVAALVAVMGANVIYNIVLARTRSPRAAYLGIIWFLPPLAVLQAALLVADPISAALHLIYVAWVIGYDLPIMRALSQLNA
jgi:tryptophan-rich sensory protein